MSHLPFPKYRNAAAGDDRKVLKGVRVEMAYYDARRVSNTWEVYNGLECTVAVAQKHADRAL